MSENFKRFKARIRQNALIKCIACAVAAGAAPVGAVMLAMKISTVPFAWFWYPIIGVGGAALGFGAAYLLTLRSDMRIARRLDSDFGLKERVRTMVEYRDKEGGIAELQREDTDERLSVGSDKKYLYSGLVGFAIAVVVAVALLVVALAWPTPDMGGSGGSDPEDEPTYEMTNWQVVALEELIKTVRESGMEEEPRLKTVAQLQSLLDILNAGISENAMRDKVKGVVEAIDAYVDEANSFDEISESLKNTDNEAVKAMHSALGSLTVSQTREAFDPLKALLYGSTEATMAFADNLSDAITAPDLSEDDDLLVALLAFSSALESSYGRSADIDAAVDAVVSAIAPIKDRQKSNYQVGEYAVQKLMSIFGLTPAELGRVESGIHGDYDEDEDDDKGTSSGGLGTGELVFGDDGMVLDINSGEFVKYSEILTEYVRLFNEKRQDGLLDELLEKYGDEYLELLYGSGASQN